MTARVEIGLEQCLARPPDLLSQGQRFGLLMNQASVDWQGRYACDLLAERFGQQLVCLLSPQHGLWGEQQANMIESADDRYPPLGLPVYSLYSETRRPTPKMLAGIDVLVIDLQDVGTRVYTFIWTLLQCLYACVEAGVGVVVLDRPNPIGGKEIGGPLLDPNYRSFVGDAVIPMRHGLTIGEIAKLLNAELQIGAALEVVAMARWQRAMLYSETGRRWIAPSPNMPRLETALCYPGQVLLEGVNISEGRGTTVPFEVFGAPFLDPWALVRFVNETHPDAAWGCSLRPVRFKPAFDKHVGQSCGGVAIQIHDAQRFDSFKLTVALLDAARTHAPAEFAWLPPPYEYEYIKPPIDILYGSSALRERFATPRKLSATELAELSAVDAATWWSRVAPHLLYA